VLHCYYNLTAALHFVFLNVPVCTPQSTQVTLPNCAAFPDAFHVWHLYVDPCSVLYGGTVPATASACTHGRLKIDHKHRTTPRIERRLQIVDGQWLLRSRTTMRLFSEGHFPRREGIHSNAPSSDMCCTLRITKYYYYYYGYRFEFEFFGLLKLDDRGGHP
jgi:hypothetical protein